MSTNVFYARPTTPAKLLGVKPASFTVNGDNTITVSGGGGSSTFHPSSLLDPQGVELREGGLVPSLIIHPQGDSDGIVLKGYSLETLQDIKQWLFSRP